MPKRPNPFGDCSPLQFKQRVGQKDVDLGVGREQNMKAVYAKTRQLLFSASKKNFLGVQTDANENHIIRPFVPTTTEVPMEEESPPLNSGQMHISATGELTLENPGTNKDTPKSSWAALFRKKKATTGDSHCQCCKGQGASQDRCRFCEKSVCNDCIRACSSCEGHFCQLCSVMNYEDITERSFCLSCAS